MHEVADPIGDLPAKLPDPQITLWDNRIVRDDRQPDAVVRHAFESAGLDRDDFCSWPKYGPPTPLRSFRSDTLMLTVAVEPAGADKISVEVRCRAWAVERGIPVPPVRSVDVSLTWFVADYVQAVQAQGAEYVGAGLDVADSIASSEVPDLPDRAMLWRAPRKTLIQRTARLAFGGVPLRPFLAARRAADQLAPRCCSHGDFYRRNVINAGTGRVSVVDWEFVGWAPRFTDHLRFWSTLRDDDDRQIAWARIVRGRTAGELRHIGVLARWLAWRLLAENLSAPVSQRDPLDLSHARALVNEIEDLSPK